MGPWTKNERLQAGTLQCLADDGPDSGWNLWQDYARENELDESAFSPFKNALAALEREGHIVKTGKFHFPQGKKQLKHWGTAEWKITPSGRERVKELLAKVLDWTERRDEEESWEEWVDRDITCDDPAPIEVWRELCRRVQKHGTLAVRFTRVTAEVKDNRR